MYGSVTILFFDIWVLKIDDNLTLLLFITYDNVV